MTPTGWSSPLWESNPRHQPYHGCALPTELRGRSRARQGRGPTCQCIGLGRRSTPPNVAAAGTSKLLLSGHRVRSRTLAACPAPGAAWAIDQHPARHRRRRRGDRRDLQPRGHRLDGDVRPRAAHARAAAGVAGGPQPAPSPRSWPSTPIAPGRRLRLAVALQGARRLPHDRRGLGLRRTATTPAAASARRCSSADRGRPRVGLPLDDRPHRGQRRGLAGAARQLRIRAGRHRA